VIAGASTDPGVGVLQAVVLGIVEGLTEFLPVSSTGHLIVVQRLLGLQAGEANNLFVVGIQGGAITAILVLYWRRLLAAARTALRPSAGQPNLLWQIALAALPAALLGWLANDWIDSVLFTPLVVAITMVAGGVLLLALERWLARGARPQLELGVVSYRIAFAIGWFQCLALVPGTSRSAATIGGALLLGLSRTAAAEFSFLVGLPILYGAAALSLAKHGDLLRGDAVLPFVVGAAVSFASAMVVVVPFVRFLRQHTFVPFAWYRLVGGVLLLLALAGGVL
jgi:undecaprenyl-diphosphatase